MIIILGVVNLGVGMNLVDNHMAVLVSGGRDLLVGKSWKAKLDSELK